MGYEICVWDILLSHVYLMISRVSVQEGEEFASRHRINNLVYLWKRKRIFGTFLIETHKIYAHTYTSIERVFRVCVGSSLHGDQFI